MFEILHFKYWKAWLCCLCTVSLSIILTFSTPLHDAIASNNDSVFTVLLPNSGLDLEHVNSDGHTVLSLALQHEPSSGCYDDQSFASRLLKRGCSLDAAEKSTGDALIHKVARLGNQTAAFFLLDNGCNANIPNFKVLAWRCAPIQL